jgi:hypothetical protein
MQLAPGLEADTIIRRDIVCVETRDPLARLVFGTIIGYGPFFANCRSLREAISQISFYCFYRRHEYMHELDTLRVVHSHAPSNNLSLIQATTAR